MWRHWSFQRAIRTKGDGRRGFLEHAPPDALHAGAGSFSLSVLFTNQLAINERIILLVGGGPFHPDSAPMDKIADGFSETEAVMASSVSLLMNETTVGPVRGNDTVQYHVRGHQA